MSGEISAIVFPFWFKAFLFTLVVEGIVSAGVAKAFRLKLSKVIFANASGTCLTHPLLWFVWSTIPLPYWLNISTGEVLVTVIEAGVVWFFVRPIRAWQAIAISVIANGASYGLGMLLGA